MAKRKIIIAGGRNFNNLNLLEDKTNYFLSNAIKSGDKIEIVSGRANGADKLGEKYAEKNGYDIAYFPANWNKYGKRAGYLRNEEMAEYADALIAYWDGKSRGTKHMIDLAKKHNLHVRIVRYDK